jgi:mannosyl-3-phosphoglycerate phosphatase
MHEGGRAGVGLVVFTDLDACLLDERTYSFEAAREALEALSRKSVPVVPVTSKTRLEVAALAVDIGLDGPWIVENGGAIVLPRRGATEAAGSSSAGDRDVLPLGVPRPRLVAALEEMAREAGTHVRGFASFDRETVSALTGLDPEAADRALAREYDEPFILEEPVALEALARLAAIRGLELTGGGRFHHLSGPSDKGKAVVRLLSLLEAELGEMVSIGLGDSPNDLPMLAAVDRPIVVPRADGRPDVLVSRGLPRAELAPCPGPRGWNLAIMAVLEGRRLPAVGGSEEARP